MKRPRILEKLIPSQRILAVREILESELDMLWKEYMPEISKQCFLNQYIFPDSKYLALLSSRVVALGAAELLVSDDMQARIEKVFGKCRIVPNFFFVRVAFVKGTSDSKAKVKNVVTTPLHYDNYGVDTVTGWIPLQDIDFQTGGLCWTVDEKLIEMTGAGMSPADMHSKSSDDEFMATYIPLLENNLRQVRCSSGDVVFFDRNLLHGATLPMAKDRYSLDFRWEILGKGNNKRLDCTREKSLDAVKRCAIEESYRSGDMKFIARLRYWEFPIFHITCRVWHWLRIIKRLLKARKFG